MAPIRCCGCIFRLRGIRMLRGEVCVTRRVDERKGGNKVFALVERRVR